MSDIFRYSSMEDHLEILEWTLRIRHISPTAPDTLGNGVKGQEGPNEGACVLGGLASFVPSNPALTYLRKSPDAWPSFRKVLWSFPSGLKATGSISGVWAGQSLARCPRAAQEGEGGRHVHLSSPGSCGDVWTLAGRAATSIA